MDKNLEDPGYISLTEGMRLAGYVPEHNPIDYQEVWEFFERISKINLEVRDPKLQKLFTIIDQQKEQEQSFDEQEYLKILLSVVMDLDLENHETIIKEIAVFHERDVDEDEKDMFVNMLISSVEAKKEHYLSKLNVVPVTEASKPSVEETEVVKPIKRKRLKIVQEQVFILHNKKETPTPVTKNNRNRKSSVSSRQKVISVLEKSQSFLIYQEAFPLPKGIKRIRIKENFDKILQFIEEYITKKNLPVRIIVEKDRAKVLFKDIKKTRMRHKTQIRVKAA
ncbi:TPA: hypothetical protein DIC40_02830 [Patescibacteria group bacterium]|nr:hypothetical protein P148_SR1C00001G0356 [candidate division SR1 bacterium RAAC1_SR1_1]HCY20782.1 hypothetical protein [Candidatus Gracilibacteria bacterium]